MIDEHARKGDWTQTFSNRKFWPLDPRADEVYIEDIAHALSMLCRFNGHCERFYSVAEHSVWVSRECDPKDALWGLLHDACETWIVDLTRPVKKSIPQYCDIEEALMIAVCVRFGLRVGMPASVRRADDAILADEAQQIMGSLSDTWVLPQPPSGRKILCLSPELAKALFLSRFHELTVEF
jgi:hypothetical protein